MDINGYEHLLEGNTFNLSCGPLVSNFHFRLWRSVWPSPVPFHFNASWMGNSTLYQGPSHPKPHPSHPTHPSQRLPGSFRPYFCIAIIIKLLLLRFQFIVGKYLHVWWSCSFLTFLKKSFQLKLPDPSSPLSADFSTTIWLWLTQPWKITIFNR
jgi:hypothetical protein